MRRLAVLLVLATLAVIRHAHAQEFATIDILSPPQNAVVPGSSVTIDVLVTDFTLVPPTGTGQEPGEGHIIYYLDVEPPFVPGEPAIPTDPDVSYAVTDKLTHTFDSLAPGEHGVWVLLVMHNDVPLIPPAIDKVSFRVLAPSETPGSEPTPGVTEEARSIDVETVAATPTTLGSPTPAVLPATVPMGGGDPEGSGRGIRLLPLLIIVATAGTFALVGGSISAARIRRGRR